MGIGMGTSIDYLSRSDSSHPAPLQQSPCPFTECRKVSPFTLLLLLIFSVSVSPPNKGLPSECHCQEVNNQDDNSWGHELSEAWFLGVSLSRTGWRTPSPLTAITATTMANFSLSDLPTNKSLKSDLPTCV